MKARCGLETCWQAGQDWKLHQISSFASLILTERLETAGSNITCEESRVGKTLSFFTSHGLSAGGKVLSKG